MIISVSLEKHMSDEARIFDREAFGRAVRDRLVDLGWSFRRATREIGVSTPTLNRIARGHEPDVENYLRVSSWLAADGVPATWLNTGEQGGSR